MVCSEDMSVAQVEFERWRRYTPAGVAPGDAQALRAFLAGYTEPEICRLNLKNLESYAMARAEERAARHLGWLPQMISRCDGVKTWLDHSEWARSWGMIPQTVTAEEFADLLASLVRAGMLTCQSC